MPHLDMIIGHSDLGDPMGRGDASSLLLLIERHVSHGRTEGFDGEKTMRLDHTRWMGLQL
jgi:hypothetical protein